MSMSILDTFDEWWKLHVVSTPYRSIEVARPLDAFVIKTIDWQKSNSDAALGAKQFRLA